MIEASIVDDAGNLQMYDGQLNPISSGDLLQNGTYASIHYDAGHITDGPKNADLFNLQKIFVQPGEEFSFDIEHPTLQDKIDFTEEISAHWTHEFNKNWDQVNYPDWLFASVDAVSCRA